MADPILISEEDTITNVTLNRPDRLNREAQEISEEMLLTASMGLRLSKDALNRNIDTPGCEAALALEDRQQALLAQTQNATEAQSAFLEKRRPEFRGH
ncbi:MAG: hypothetical protein AAGI28_02690 [Pseudomonadota bacterium]